MKFPPEAVRAYLYEHNLINSQNGALDPLGIYKAALAYGVMGTELDYALGWPNGTADDWVSMQGLRPLSFITVLSTGDGGELVSTQANYAPSDGDLFREITVASAGGENLDVIRNRLMDRYSIPREYFDRVFIEQTYASAPAIATAPSAGAPIIYPTTPIPQVPTNPVSVNMPPQNVQTVQPVRVTNPLPAQLAPSPNPIAVAPFPTGNLPPSNIDTPAAPASIDAGSMVKLGLAALAALTFFK